MKKPTKTKKQQQMTGAELADLVETAIFGPGKSELDKCERDVKAQLHAAMENLMLEGYRLDEQS